MIKFVRQIFQGGLAIKRFIYWPISLNIYRDIRKFRVFRGTTRHLHYLPAVLSREVVFPLCIHGQKIAGFEASRRRPEKNTSALVKATV